MLWLLAALAPGFAMTAALRATVANWLCILPMNKNAHVALCRTDKEAQFQNYHSQGNVLVTGRVTAVTGDCDKTNHERCSLFFWRCCDAFLCTRKIYFDSDAADMPLAPGNVTMCERSSNLCFCAHRIRVSPLWICMPYLEHHASRHSAVSSCELHSVHSLCCRSAGLCVPFLLSLISFSLSATADQSL